MQRFKFAGAFVVMALMWAGFQAEVVGLEGSESPLHKAISNLDVEGVRAALGAGADPNERYNRSGRSAISSVTINVLIAGRANLDCGICHLSMEEAEERTIAILDLLFEAGASLGKHDDSILVTPALAGSVRLTQYLLDRGANPNASEDGMTAVMLATKYRYSEVVKLLVQHGATPTDKVTTSQIRFIAAAGKGDVDAMRYELSQGATVDGRSPSDETALVTAAGKQQLRAVVFLLEKGANPNLPGKYILKESPLHAAVWDNAELFQHDGGASIVRLLLKAGAHVSSTQAYRGQTPLHIAARLHNELAVKMLLEAGAKILARDEDGKTPFDYAESGPVIQLIQSFSKETSPPRQNSSENLAVVPKPQVPVISDVDIPPTVRSVPKKNAYALVIGIEQYREKLPKADFAAHDAKIVGQYLHKVVGYPEENVVVLLNDRATRTDIEKYVESWLPNHVEKDGSVFVYFSGHGVPNVKTGDAYLVPFDGDPAFVEKTGYPVKRLYEALEKLPTKETVVMLDSCFSGAGGRSVIAQGTRPMVLSVENPILAAGKTVVLAASAGDQVSSTYQQKSHGLLTYFFLKGLGGEADANKDGSVELAELYDYLKPQVSRVARREYNNDQTPQLVGSPEALKKGVKLVEKPAP